MSEFNGLVEREIPRLRRYARALTRSADRADDLVQETLLRAISKSHLWQTGTDIRAWLFTIMHNHYVNMVRRAMRDEATVDIEQMSSSLVAVTDPTASSQLRELEQSLARLPGEQREVILLVGLEGMSYETAAKILSVPVGTVRSRLSRGRDALRRLMGLPEKAARTSRPRAKPRLSRPSGRNPAAWHRRNASAHLASPSALLELALEPSARRDSDEIGEHIRSRAHRPGCPSACRGPAPSGRVRGRQPCGAP